MPEARDTDGTITDSLCQSIGMSALPALCDNARMLPERNACTGTYMDKTKLANSTASGNSWSCPSLSAMHVAIVV